MNAPKVNPRKSAFVERTDKQRTCPHLNTYVKHEGQTGLLGRVVCDDCGADREWEAY